MVKVQDVPLHNFALILAHKIATKSREIRPVTMQKSKNTIVKTTEISMKILLYFNKGKMGKP